MKIKSLELENFRGIVNHKVYFDPVLTVFAGRNGGGKSTILDLNAATTEKDSARRNYMTAMQTYWTLYYGLRSMTQYDFEHDRPLWHNLPTEL